VYEVYCLALAPSGNIFAGTYFTGLWRSTDTGHSWGDVSAGTGGLPESDTDAGAVNSKGTVFVGTYKVNASPLLFGSPTQHREAWTDCLLP
jgi:hypothetical protein